MGNPTFFIIAIIVFALALVILNRAFADKQAKYKKRSLQSITRGDEFENQHGSALLEDNVDKFGETMQNAPIIGKIYKKLKHSGSTIKLAPYLLILGMIFIVGTYIGMIIFRGMLPLALIIGFLPMFMFNNVFIGMKIEKRNDQFLQDFPDAIDMIVRSIRSGHPMLSSLRLIAENSRPPISTEVQRVIDEVAYGRPLPESLRKMADRIGILDVNFFVVILSVQQETGGSMAEVLGNLSNIIRKRKQLRLKIRALTSEGRITTWIFSVIPFVQVAAVYAFARDYLDPLFQTGTGLTCLGIAVSLISLAIYISRQLCKMEI